MMMKKMGFIIKMKVSFRVINKNYIELDNVIYDLRKIKYLDRSLFLQRIHIVDMKKTFLFYSPKRWLITSKMFEEIDKFRGGVK